MTAAAPTAIDFDPYDYAFQEDPYPMYARLRRESPLNYSERHGIWTMARHADIHRALRQERIYSNAMGVSIDASAWGPNAYRVMSFLAMDPPQQTRLRSLVSRGFTPRRVNELEGRIRQIAEHYLDRALHEETFDWIGEVAGRLPMDVISELLGVPDADRRELRRLADLVVHREDGMYDVPPEGMAASLELVQYYADMVAERRRRPGDDLTSALLAAELDGDRLTDDEIIGFLFLMVVAGNETTTKLLGNALYHLSRHPDQLAAVLTDGRADPAATTGWIEETLRYDTSSQMIARHLLEDVELHGTVAPAGSKLLFLLGSANRDDEAFSRADEYDVTRDKSEFGNLLSFGAGRHFCLGVHLARLEARVALDELIRRVSAIEVDRDRAVRVHSVNVRGFAELPVRMKVR